MRPQIDPLPAWLALLAICFGVVSLACLVTPGQCVELQLTGNATGAGIHMLEIGNNSSTVLLENITGWSIVSCPNTLMTEVRREMR